MGDYIRGVCHGGLKKYQKVWVTLEGFSSDRKPCAQGVRAGMCNLLGQYMPAEFVVFATGHDFEELSALYNYIDATEASMMPSAVVLAGYPAFPWGQNGTGPRPMSLRALEVRAITARGIHHAITVGCLAVSLTTIFFWIRRSKSACMLTGSSSVAG